MTPRGVGANQNTIVSNLIRTFFFCLDRND